MPTNKIKQGVVLANTAAGLTANTALILERLCATLIAFEIIASKISIYTSGTLAAANCFKIFISILNLILNKKQRTSAVIIDTAYPALMSLGVLFNFSAIFLKFEASNSSSSKDNSASLISLTLYFLSILSFTVAAALKITNGVQTVYQGGKEYGRKTTIRGTAELFTGISAVTLAGTETSAAIEYSNLATDAALNLPHKIAGIIGTIGAFAGTSKDTIDLKNNPSNSDEEISLTRIYKPIIV